MTPGLKTDYSRQYYYRVRLSNVLTHGLKGADGRNGKGREVPQNYGADPIRLSNYRPHTGTTWSLSIRTSEIGGEMSLGT